MFIALEGIDGCGKSMLAKELAKKGYVVTQEPFLSCITEIGTYYSYFLMDNSTSCYH